MAFIEDMAAAEDTFEPGPIVLPLTEEELLWLWLWLGLWLGLWLLALELLRLPDRR